MNMGEYWLIEKVKEALIEWQWESHHYPVSLKTKDLVNCSSKLGIRATKRNHKRK